MSTDLPRRPTHIPIPSWYSTPESEEAATGYPAVYETKEGVENIAAYYGALGEFIDTFAQTEADITRTLLLYSSAPVKIARIAFASAKIDAGSTFIRQFAAAIPVGENKLDDLTYILQQLGIINGVRNLVVHYGTEMIAQGAPVVTNAIKAKDAPVLLPISATALREMSFDLRKISYHLHYNHLGREQPRSQINQRAIESVLRSRWRYRRPSPPPDQTTGKKSLRSGKRGQR